MTEWCRRQAIDCGELLVLVVIDTDTQKKKPSGLIKEILVEPACSGGGTPLSNPAYILVSLAIFVMIQLLAPFELRASASKDLQL